MSLTGSSTMATGGEPAQSAGFRPVRVCFMIDNLAVAGTESQLIALIRRLDRCLVRPSLCLLDGTGEGSRVLEPGGDCPVLRLGIRSLRHPATVVKAVRLARFLRREQVDVLQVYFPDSTYLGVLVGLLARVPSVVRTKNNLNHWMTPLDRVLNRLLNPLVTATVANSEPCRRAVLAVEKPAAASVFVLENGVDLTRFSSQSRAGPARPPADTRRVGVVANLRWVKGLDVFARAAAELAARHPDVEYEVAGEGDQRPELVRLAGDLGLAGRFHLPGAITDIPAFLSRLDIAVLCSRSEGMSNAVLEYMAAGCAIVATAVGATPDLIEDGVHGLLVPPDDPHRLAEAVDRLLRDPDLAGRLAAAARCRVRERYSREAMVERFEDFFQALAGRSRGAGRSPREAG